MLGPIERLTEEPALLGESPCWDQKRQRLYWVDILQKRLHWYDTLSQKNHTIQLQHRIGCVAARKRGGLILALENGFSLLDLETKKITFLADPEEHLSSHRFNDGKCDPTGRFWAGTMSLDESLKEGSLYSLDAERNVQRWLENLGISNGIGWSPDFQKMYFIDSPTREIVAFDYDTGSLSHRRVVITIPEDAGYPDGMTVDREGMLWIALWGGGKVTRWNPATGKLLDEIPVPACHATSCTFGGPRMSDLYITTAQKDMNPTQRKTYPHAGCLFRIKTEFVGMESFEFAG